VDDGLRFESLVKRVGNCSPPRQRGGSRPSLAARPEVWQKGWWENICMRQRSTGWAHSGMRP